MVTNVDGKEGRPMSRPKLEVNSVWILQEVMPYEGSEILGVFIDPEVAKKDRQGQWREMTDSTTGEKFWTTQPLSPRQSYHEFYLLDQHDVRTK